MILRAIENEDRSVDEVWEGVRNAWKEAADCTIRRNSTVTSGCVQLGETVQ